MQRFNAAATLSQTFDFFSLHAKAASSPLPSPLTCEAGVSYGTFLPIDNSKAATYGKFFLDNDEALLYFWISMKTFYIANK